MSDTITAPVAVADVCDLAGRLADLGVLLDPEPHLGHVGTYTGVDWNPERTQPGHLHVNVYRNDRRALEAVRQAVTAGATAVCWATAPTPLPADLSALLRSRRVALLRVTDQRRAFSLASALLHRFPGDRLTSVGITGTNAKTTTAIMLSACLQRAGIANGLSTSLAAAVGSTLLPPGLSTPDPPQLQELLARFVGAGATHAVVEASSQGLSDLRLADVPFSVGVCTTIGPDHLDVHGSDEAYRRAKRMLFDGLGPDGFAIYNADEADVVEVAAGTGAVDVPVGTGEDAVARRQGPRLRFTAELAERCGGEPCTVNLATPWIEGHDLTSAALAATAAFVWGAGPEDIEAGLGDFVGLPRRLSVVATRPFVVVDDMFNAHSAATTVERRLRTLRDTTSRLLCGVAVRGNRGVDTNAEQGDLLGRALTNLDADEVHLTRSIEVVGPADRASDAEYEAILDGLRSWGLRVTVHAQLDTLVDAMYAGARPGDLLAFVGHTGMEPAVGLLRERLAATGRRGRRLAAAFVDADDQIRTSTGRSPGTGTPPKGQP
ncbi:MAG: hypothetical protein KDB24_04405 [Microthrixaceae bacterium]|nr:hypothetical protein [Microthrixaceae bacterium]